MHFFGDANSDFMRIVAICRATGTRARPAAFFFFVRHNEMITKLRQAVNTF